MTKGFPSLLNGSKRAETACTSCYSQRDLRAKQQVVCGRRKRREYFRVATANRWLPLIGQRATHSILMLMLLEGGFSSNTRFVSEGLEVCSSCLERCCTTPTPMQSPSRAESLEDSSIKSQGILSCDNNVDERQRDAAVDDQPNDHSQSVHANITTDFCYVRHFNNLPSQQEDDSHWRIPVMKRGVRCINWCIYTIQLTMSSRDLSSIGSPVEFSTIGMDTIPACGIPADPVLTAVTIKLKQRFRVSAVLKPQRPTQTMAFLMNQMLGGKLKSFADGGGEGGSKAGADEKETPESKGMSREEFEEYQKQLVEEKIQRDKDFTTKKAERANLRVALRDKYRLPDSALDGAMIQMAGDDVDLPEELAKMVDEDEEEEETNDSFLHKLQNMDLDELKTKAQSRVSELRQTAEEKCVLITASALDSFLTE
ncbi:hypothetical protein CCH79_00009612, partial [Gambusia affinis]